MTSFHVRVSPGVSISSAQSAVNGMSTRIQQVLESPASSADLVADLIRDMVESGSVSTPIPFEESICGV